MSAHFLHVNLIYAIFKMVNRTIQRSSSLMLLSERVSEAEQMAINCGKFIFRIDRPCSQLFPPAMEFSMRVKSSLEGPLKRAIVGNSDSMFVS